MEIEETALALQETGEYETLRDEEDQSSGTDTSHRRRRAMAAHHKDYIGEDPKESDDEGDGHCLMAMGRDISSRSSSSSRDPVPPVDHLPEGENEDIGDDEETTKRTGELETDQEEDTNLDEDLRLRLIGGESCQTQSQGRGGGMQQRGGGTLHGWTAKAIDLSHSLVEVQSGALGVTATKPDP